MCSRGIFDTAVSIDKVVVKLSVLIAEDRAGGSDPVVRVLDRAGPLTVDKLYVVVVEVLVFNGERIVP